MRTLEVQLYPNTSQRKYLSEVMGCYRKVYNLALAKSIEVYEAGGRMTTLADLSKYFHGELLKNPEYSYLLDHNTKILKDSLKNLSGAYSNFFKKHNKNVGLPNFKKKGDNDSIGIYDEAFSNKVFDKKNFMFISNKFGHIRYRTSKEYKYILDNHADKVKRITIKKTPSGKYFAKIVINLPSEQPDNQLDTENNTVGVDLGIKSFAVTSDAVIYDNLRLEKRFAKKLARQQRSLARKQMLPTDKTYFNKKWNKEVTIKTRSNNREKQRIKVARTYEKISNIKQNYLHNITKTLINENQVITVEDLNVKGMMKNHCLAKAIQDVSFAEFRTILTYKALWYGRNLVVADRFFPSTKMCNVCKTVNKKITLKDREWTCTSCNTHHDRDMNSAINLDNYGKDEMKNRETVPQINACGDQQCGPMTAMSAVAPGQ